MQILSDTTPTTAPTSRYTLSILAVDDYGTIHPRVLPNAVIDSAGTGNLPSTSHDNTVTYTLPLPPASAIHPWRIY